ncbi:MAG: ubiquitin-like protein Pup [Candidatus Nanopelagicales bacterium]|jgi:ubiquitin-like protein Pup
MAEREQITSTGQSHDEDSHLETNVTQSDTNRADELLDEIDAVLEKNAAEFVKGFVQKGGQ